MKNFGMVLGVFACIMMISTLSFAGNGRGMRNGHKRSRDGSNCGIAVNSE